MSEQNEEEFEEITPLPTGGRSAFGRDFPDGPSPSEVWDTLSSIDVSDHVEEKNGLSYLSWMWAWTYLMNRYPQAHMQWREDGGYEDGVYFHRDNTATVQVAVQIGPHVRREMWLPVMDYKNNAIANPNARQISDTKMRCLVKCLGFLGLGSYLYAGEDLPMDPERDRKVENAIASLRQYTRKYMNDYGKTLPGDIKNRGIEAIKSRNLQALEAALTDVKNLIRVAKEAADKAAKEKAEQEQDQQEQDQQTPDTTSDSDEEQSTHE